MAKKCVNVIAFGVYNNKGNYDKALEHYGKALEILKRTLGKDHPNTLFVQKNIDNAKSQLNA